MNFLRYFPKIFLVTATLSLSACDLKKKDITPTKKQPASTVILLNGTSSAGKTTMLKELVKIDDSVQVVSFDGFFWGSYTKTHPTAELDELAKIARKDETANQKLNKLVEVYMRNAVDSFYADIRQKALKYKNVVVDTVIDDVKEFDKLSHVLGEVKLVNVLLYCPLDVTISRLRQRNIAGIEMRDFRLPVSQYKLLYKPQEQPSEKIVDTILGKDIKQLVRAGIEEYLKDPPDDLKDQVDALSKELEELYKGFVKHFKLDELDKVAIVPVRPYDLILHCEKDPQKLAQELAQLIEAQKK